jgi:hypothetical protein
VAAPQQELDDLKEQCMMRITIFATTSQRIQHANRKMIEEIRVKHETEINAAVTAARQQTQSTESS